MQRVPITTCFLARLRSRQRFCVALVRIRAELGVGGEDDGDGASDGVIVAIPQRKLLEQAIVALQVNVQRRCEYEIAFLPPEMLLLANGVERQIPPMAT
ncbi:unnamed protein product [Prunus armeniaca]